MMRLGAYRTGSTPGSAVTRSRNAVAADFEIAVLVERGAGRRQQHHRIGQTRASASRAASATATSSVSLISCGTLSPSVTANSVRGLADQIGLADAREIFGAGR